MDDADSVYGDIEVQTAVLTRNFELLRRRSADPEELDRAEYLLLRALTRLGPSSISKLGQALGLDPSTVGRQVAVLEESGLAERRQDSEDRRRAIVAATASGKRRMRVASSKRQARTKELLTDWSHEELAALVDSFARYNQAVARHHLTGPAGLADRSAT